MDTKLTMAAAVDALERKRGPKVKALLRTSPYYDQCQLVQGYKAHVLCILEGATGAIYHASASVLQKLDRVQDRFLRAVGLSDREAFLQHNLTTLGLRRVIAMLGLLFRCVSGLAHDGLCSLFLKTPAAGHRHDTRNAAARHSHQLEETWERFHLDTARRSFLGLVRAWDLLPAEILENRMCHHSKPP